MVLKSANGGQLPTHVNQQKFSTVTNALWTCMLILE